MMPMNNPLMMLLNAAQNGGNPMAMIEQLAMRDPKIQQAANIMRGKTPQQIRQIAINMAKERGTSVEEIASSLGFRLK